MHHIKSDSQISYITKSGQISAYAMKKVLTQIKPGITTLELDKIANDEIKKLGGEISFQTVESYPYTICATVNDDVVHGLPTTYKLKEGDVVGIDLGAIYKGWHSDMAETVSVGEIPQKISNFLKVGKKALNLALKKAIVGNRIGDISFAIQTTVESAGFSIVRELTGHGVGRRLHEDPIIPGIGKFNTGKPIEKGMTIAIEVIYTMGRPEVVYKNDDGWTISTKDNSLAGLFERTVLVTDHQPIVLTLLD